MFALLPGLQIDLDASAVESRIRTINSDERREAFHCGSFRITLASACWRSAIAVKEMVCSLPKFRESPQCPESGRIPLGMTTYNSTVETSVASATSSIEALMIQHPAKRSPIPRDNRIERALRRLIETALLRFGFMAQKPRRHHWRQRQRDNGGNEDRHAQSDRKLAEQAANYVTHEQKRNQNRDQGNRQRNNRETDLRRALQGGFERLVAVLDDNAKIFSIMTMASSTTNPVAIVSAISVRLFRLYPRRYITPNVPTSDKGTATLGITVPDAVRRKRKITKTTSAIVSISSN